MTEISESEKALLLIREAEQKNLWDLYKTIGGFYRSGSDAWQDMVKLGKLAQGLLELDSARYNIRKGNEK